MDNLFGERLRSLRMEKDMSQEELGETFGVGKVTISGYERGTRTPTFDMLMGFAEFFHVSTDYLLGRTDNRAPVKSLEAMIASSKALNEVLAKMDPSEQDKFLEFAMWTLQTKAQNRP
ncbi:helix-turn-helix domain-containing protein [Brevibacillus porteri]|uniref:helix-turn-helix domain-containing protein n=1 Tax=Brevibacillus porteri TaxID=2126350 RepID=UPI003D1B5779